MRAVPPDGAGGPRAQGAEDGDNEGVGGHFTVGLQQGEKGAFRRADNVFVRNQAGVAWGRVG